MAETAAKAKAPRPRTRVVTELTLRDQTISTPRGALTVIMPGNAHGVTMVADLDARTIGIKVPKNGTTIVPFEAAKCFKYGMGRPAED